MRSDLLHRLQIHLEAGLAGDARRVGQPEATARILLALDPAKGLPMAEVAKRTLRDPSTATRFVDRAERDGLVAREAGADRRRRLVFLTTEGREARARLLAVRDARAAALPEAIQARTGLGTDEVEWFVAALADALAAEPGARRATGTPPPPPPPPEPPEFRPTIP